jgi:FlgD Ig-like domain
MRIRSIAILAFCLAISALGVPRLGATPLDIQAGDAADGTDRSGTGTASRDMLGASSAVVDQTVYFEDFENGAGGWTNTDIHEGIKWHTTGYDALDGHGARGVWWAGEEAGCWPGGGGYANNWDQNLTKTFTLGSAPVYLTLTHQYLTESGYDWCSTLVSTDGGASWTAVAGGVWSGNSGGFGTDVVDLSYWHDQTIQLRFEFKSDTGVSNEDGSIGVAGGWRIDQAQITGYSADTFESGGDGWSPTEQPSYVAEAPISYRLEADPPCDGSLFNCPDYGHSWVAYDPELGRVPQVTDRPGDAVPVLAGIISPEIPVPTGVDHVFLDFDVFHDTQRVGSVIDNTFYDWTIVSIFPDGCERRASDGSVWYHAAGGWFHYRRDITGYLYPGATSFRVELTDLDFTQYLLYYGYTPTYAPQLGPYFDNVQISTSTNVDFVDVAGTVSGCNGPLAGVTVDLNHPDGSMFTTTTDASGAYAFTGLDAALDDADVAIVVSLGYIADNPSPAQALAPLTADQTVDFSLACLEPQGEARSMGYWKHQANVYLNGKGSAQESQADMESNFPSAIFNHFYENGLNAIRVDGVTFMDDGSGNDVPLDLATIHATLSVKGNAGMEAQAKQQYLALLLNLASGKLLTSSAISDDGGTASQALQQMAAYINDGDPGNDETAKDIGDAINNAQMVAAGVIDLGLTTIAYSQPSVGIGAATTLLGAAPNPFLSSTAIRFNLKEPGRAAVTVYDITGRMVRSVFNGQAEAGLHQVTWDGTDARGSRVAPGIYYVRMATEDYAATKRAVFIR